MALLSVTALVTSGVDAGLVGLVLSYALNTTSSLVSSFMFPDLYILTAIQNWVVRSASEVEQNIVSVERILHQTEVAPEAPYEESAVAIPAGWPAAGSVEFV